MYAWEPRNRVITGSNQNRSPQASCTRIQWIFGLPGNIGAFFFNMTGVFLLLSRCVMTFGSLNVFVLFIFRRVWSNIILSVGNSLGTCFCWGHFSVIQSNIVSHEIIRFKKTFYHMQNNQIVWLFTSMVVCSLLLLKFHSLLSLRRNRIKQILFLWLVLQLGLNFDWEIFFAVTHESKSFIEF